MLCLPWDSFLVSNDRPKIEQVFELRQDGAVEKPRLWRKILHVQRVNNGSLDGRSGAIGDPHHPEGAPVGELTGIRHILPQDGRQFLARDFASLRRCAMRSRIATHSQEVRSLQRYELKSTVAAQLRCAGTGGDGRSGGGAGHCSVERETRFRQTAGKKSSSHSSLTKADQRPIEVVATRPPTLWGTR